MVAYAVRWSPGDEVLIGRGDFPVHYATWKPMEEREDIKLSIVTPRDRFITADDFVEALTPRSRLVSVSHVRFDTGALAWMHRDWPSVQKEWDSLCCSMWSQSRMAPNHCHT